MAQSIEFYNIPYDIRLALFQRALQDESRVANADATLAEGIDTDTIAIPGAGTHESSVNIVNSFRGSIVPARYLYVDLAIVFFAPEIKDSPHFLQFLFSTQPIRHAIENPKSIFFIADVFSFTKPLIEDSEALESLFAHATKLWREERSNKERWAFWEKAHRLRLGEPPVTWDPQGTVENIAFSLRSILRLPHSTDDEIRKDFYRAILTMPHLKIIYLVVDYDQTGRKGQSQSSRFKKFVCRIDTVYEGTGTERKQRKTLSTFDVVSLQEALKARSTMQSYQDENKSSLCPKIEIVSWA
ncbi:hypothetical protein ONS95_005239 [Cadophora gregata]|uniref:uncharacterized protein n=1 Tax=Cadophora gregata TaxID=51156 RepID=UPI0026DD8DEC|nr:uncharacterized protein ONS95_011785 [Cadophora gregata]XP_058349184.1 uncharacterized protein ONS95_008460 [Cadophora gregata]XP_058352153.1 uncharacterized protein ONS95_005239 [Cadophora gregata]KAK0114939.1 hypothetical protein ONS96_013414 [Cadophora gregata f. sp. sojae]KAK0099546.1 hypothetical protein ONS95_011785 [Cadophora gregata]KAK0100120.1 hypothetical protein ONS95_008460 [Cadophora gregata]KAK0104978.1 hypothetical protein ONS95_005239 [Cadophora gregata]